MLLIGRTSLGTNLYKMLGFFFVCVFVVVVVVVVVVCLFVFLNRKKYIRNI